MVEPWGLEHTIQMEPAFFLSFLMLSNCCLWSKKFCDCNSRACDTNHGTEHWSKDCLSDLSVLNGGHCELQGDGSPWHNPWYQSNEKPRVCAITSWPKSLSLHKVICSGGYTSWMRSNECGFFRSFHSKVEQPCSLFSFQSFSFQF